jgi:hypothetical protein
MYINLIFFPILRNNQTMFRDPITRKNQNTSSFMNFRNRETQEKGNILDSEFLVIKKIDINLRDKGPYKDKSPDLNTKKNNLLLSSIKNRIVNEYDDQVSPFLEKNSCKFSCNSVILPKIINVATYNNSNSNPLRTIEFKITEKSPENFFEKSDEKKTLIKPPLLAEKIIKVNKPLDSVDQLKQLQSEKKAMFQASKEKVYYVTFVIIT